MIDYAYLCQAIQHWRAGERPPGNPPVPSSEYEELDADVMVDEDEQGYTEQAYTEQSYADQGYAEQSYGEPVPHAYEQTGYEQNYEGEQPAYDAGQRHDDTVLTHTPFVGYDNDEQPEPGDVTMAYGGELPINDDDDERNT